MRLNWKNCLSLFTVAVLAVVIVATMYREITSEPAPEVAIKFTLDKFEESEAAGGLSKVSCAQRICNGQIRYAEDQTFNCFATLKKATPHLSELRTIVFIFYAEGRRKYFEYNALREETREVSVFEFQRSFHGRIQRINGSA